MKSKGRTPPPAAVDHAAALRDRLGKAAYVAAAAADAGAPAWERLTEGQRTIYRAVGQAVMNEIVVQGARTGEFFVNSIYGYASKKPYVNVEVSVSPMQMSPGKAREIALMLLESADAAESDSVLMAFARNEIGLDDTRAAQLLDQFRKSREKIRGSEARSA